MEKGHRKLTPYQEQVLLRVVREGPVRAKEVPWQSLNVLKRNGLVQFYEGTVSYTTEGLMAVVGIAVRENRC